MSEDYSQYDIGDADEYLIPGSTCLANKLGITNTAELNQAEQEITKPLLAYVESHWTDLSFSKHHLQSIHRFLFSSVYPFAGEFRRVEIAKGGSLFLPYKLIETELDRCFASLKNENFLARLPPDSFADRAGYYLGWINKIHAFREGNGRAQRALIGQLAKQNGYAFAWQCISGAAMSIASREARTFDPSAASLRRILTQNIVFD